MRAFLATRIKIDCGAQFRHGLIGAIAGLLLGLCGLGCGPEFPPFWLIEPDPKNQDGQVDAHGKLRVLGLLAEPPEAAPGQEVKVQSLVAIHPQQGSTFFLPGESVRTPQPPSLDALWLACREPDGQTNAAPCGIGASGALELERLQAMGGSSSGPSTTLTLPAGPVPYTRLVTLFVTDGALPGGAQACFDQAVAASKTVPDPDHCVIAIKRIRVSNSDNPNHNPRIARLMFGESADTLHPLSGDWQSDLFSDTARYPLLDESTRDEERPRLLLAVERAADAVELGRDADNKPRQESLSVSFFTTAGTLEAGRGSFLDLGCEGDPESCPQLFRSDVSWQPPAARAALLAPNARAYFFVVLRDDRGGLSFMSAAVHGR